MSAPVPVPVLVKERLQELNIGLRKVKFLVNFYLSSHIMSPNTNPGTRLVHSMSRIMSEELLTPALLCLKDGGFHTRKETNESGPDWCDQYYNNGVD